MTSPVAPRSMREHDQHEPRLPPAEIVGPHQHIDRPTILGMDIVIDPAFHEWAPPGAPYVIDHRVT